MTGVLFTPNILMTLAAFTECHEQSSTLREKPSSAVLISNRTAYVLNGAVLGFATGVGMVMLAGLDPGLGALWFLPAATVVGALTGLDLYLSRKWRRFGRFTPLIRFEVACVGAAGVTSAVGVLLGLIPPRLAWSFTAFGAIAGLLYGVYLFGTAAENWPGGRKRKLSE